MRFRKLVSVGAILCVFACMTTLRARNGEERDFAPKIRTLRQLYINEMSRIVDIMRARVQTGESQDAQEELLRARVALAEAQVAVAEEPDAKIAALESCVKDLKELESQKKAQEAVGLLRHGEATKVTAERIYAEIMVLEERERQDKAK